MARSEKNESSDPPPQASLDAPVAWFRVLAAFLIFIAAWGPSLGFGAFEFFYASDFLSNYSSSAISWIGSVQATLLITTGVIAGPLCDRGWLRVLLIVSSLGLVVGFMLLSLCRQYYQVFLTQGVLLGFSAGLAYTPALSVVSVSFAKYRAIAVGLASIGTSVGGVIYPIAIRRLIVTVGFPWTARILGFLNLFLAIASLSIFFSIAPSTAKTTGVLKLREAPKSSQALFQPKAFIEPAFALFAFAGLLQFLAFYIPVFFLPTYGIQHLGLSPDLAYYMVAVLNGSSAFGRTLPSLVADKTGPFPVLVVSTFASSAILFGWIGVHNLGGFIAFVVLYGFFTGVFITCSPVCVTLKPISPDLSVFGTRLGMILVCVGLGVLIGGPSAAALVKGDDYVKAQVFAAVIMAAAGVALLYPWMVTERARKADQQQQQEAEREGMQEKV
ncbi:hypothetical protein LTR36_006798 [Oleoguttula mirabilis]|uniref:Major facilitator superfamily (MFS) profile domain-containing protein n=1 Tax=Oleoguttula mirabilis TaxID=1507867 RepID=A0AAV9JC08_9PEZI|nr:hypothetical protein LTR36_006798 [Oleoguttula mirabilis]